MTDHTRTPGVFVTGTDTGVGKTTVGCAALAELCSAGLSVGVMKPIETGVENDRPLDALALRQAAESPDPLDWICPLQFRMPVAPNVAARAEGRLLDLAPVSAAFEQIRTGKEFLWVEGAGGLLVPTNDSLCMADLANTLDLPLLVVARASLGTINHTLLTLREIDRRSHPCVGVIISHCSGPISAADEKNLADLRTRLGDRLLGELPPVSDPLSPPRGWLDLDRLIERASSHRSN